MDYKKLSEVNNNLPKIDIKGKGYVQVEARVQAFRLLFPEGRITTEIVSESEGIVIMKASAYDGDKLISTGHAMEFRNDKTSMVNQWAYLENCETSAVGRCLAFIGITGKGGEIASQEEIYRKLELTATATEKPYAPDYAKQKEAEYVFPSDPKYQRALADAQAVGVDFEKVKITCGTMGIALLNDGSIPYDTLLKSIAKRKEVIARQTASQAKEEAK